MSASALQRTTGRPSSGASSLSPPNRVLAPLASRMPAITRSPPVECFAPDATDLARALRIRLDERATPVPLIRFRHTRTVAEEVLVHVRERDTRRAARERADVRVQPVEHVKR